jgi:hypothetical protein
MVFISDAPYSLTFMDGLGRGKDQQGRSSDHPHVSAIIDDLIRRMPVPKGQKARTPYDELKGADKIFLDRMADFGFMWEWALENHSVRVPTSICPQDAIELTWKARMRLRRAQEVTLDPQGELLVDDIYLTPDARNLDSNRGEEYKSSWASMLKMREFKVNFRKWYWQIGCYCRALHVLDYDLFVFWVCGQWQPPFPQVAVYSLKYEADEVRRIWSMVLNHRLLMLREGLIK